jgi:hypothetical protein
LRIKRRDFFIQKGFLGERNAFYANKLFLGQTTEEIRWKIGLAFCFIPKAKGQGADFILKAK